MQSIAEMPEERASQRGAIARRLLGYLAPFRSQLALILVLIVTSAASQAAGPFLIGLAIDTAISQGDGQRLNWLMLALLAVYLVGMLAGRAQFRMMGAVGQRTLARMRTEIFSSIQTFSLRFFDRQPAGDLMSRLVNDTDVLNQLFSQGLVQVLGSIFGLAGIVVAMVVLDWRLALASFAVIPVMLYLTRLFSQMSRRAFRRTRASIGDVSSEIQEDLAAVRVAQAFNRTDVNQQRFERRNAANRDANVNATAITSAFTPAVDVLSTVATAIVAGYGGYLALNGQVTVGVVVAFLTYVQQFFRPIQFMTTFYTTAQSALAAAERIFGLIDTPPDLVDRPGAQVMPPIQGRVVFERVSFAYGERRAPSDEQQAPSDEQRAPSDEQRVTSNERRAPSDEQRAPSNERQATSAKQRAPSNERQATSAEQRAPTPAKTAGAPSPLETRNSLLRAALTEVSLVAAPGQTVALVGPTGAGKTTLVNMIGRFYDVSAGSVMIDGVDIREVTRASLRAQMGIVLQDSFLFSGTIADNIRYGRLGATDEEVIAAAQAAHAHEFISRLPAGYQTALGERGGGLSQGQRQLIGIARAILADPRILILDEATSSVDTRTEQLIQSALKTLLRGRTSFVIAHRLSTIRDADQVLVMDGGRIVERGTHDMLLERGGLYAELYRRQFRDEVLAA